MLWIDANRYSNFEFVNEADIAPFLDMLWPRFGKSMKDVWIPPKVTIQKHKETADIQGFFGGYHAINQRGIDVLKEYFHGTTELLPLNYEKEPYFIINVVDLVDCVDYEKSIVTRFDSGRIMGFEKYVFIEEKIKDKHIFKIIDEPERAPFVSDTFRNRVMDSGLTGFRFIEVWDSEVN